MIEELLKAGRITRYDFLAYAIFMGTEHGREFFNNMLNDLFMEEPRALETSGIEFAFIDGRRSVFRDIRRAFMTIEKQMKELNNDDGNAERQSEQ